MDVADRFGLHYASVSIFSLSLYICVFSISVLEKCCTVDTVE